MPPRTIAQLDARRRCRRPWSTPAVANPGPVAVLARGGAGVRAGACRTRGEDAEVGAPAVLRVITAASLPCARAGRHGLTAAVPPRRNRVDTPTGMAGGLDEAGEGTARTAPAPRRAGPAVARTRRHRCQAGRFRRPMREPRRPVTLRPAAASMLRCYNKSHAPPIESGRRGPLAWRAGSSSPAVSRRMRRGRSQLMGSASSSSRPGAGGVLEA